jgi:hypothetical protein
VTRVREALKTASARGLRGECPHARGAGAAGRDSCAASWRFGPAGQLTRISVPLPQRPSGDDQPGHSTRPLRRSDSQPPSSERGDAAREMGGLSLADALSLCELLANTDPQRYERAALRWLQRSIDERLPPLTEVALAASALAELRHARRNTGVETLERLLRRG